jgi:hypothetical protein
MRVEVESSRRQGDTLCAIIAREWFVLDDVAMTELKDTARIGATV